MRKIATLAAAAAFAMTAGAEAREFRVLYSNPSEPLSVMLDSAGRLVVPMYNGGKDGSGSVIRLDGDLNAKTLLVFRDGNGGPAKPLSPLLRDAASGDLLGVAARVGGARGTLVYKIGHGALTALHSFDDGNDGCGGPVPVLVKDAAGNLYGVSCRGGASGIGAIFKIAPDGTASILHEFSGLDGRWPMGDMVLGADGSLTGTAYMGGDQECGTIFRIAADGTFTRLHSFDLATEGSQLWGGLVADAKGNFYGTANNAGPGGYGTVFKLGAKGTLTVLHAFRSDGTDGEQPQGTLVRDAATGDLYGSTQEGGGGTVFDHGGTVFKIAPNGKETILHAFTDGDDGAWPLGELVMDAAGNLYGTTLYRGNVFEIVK